MATWRVQPKFKKSITERIFWKKDGNVFIDETVWRWGEFLVETEDDNPPVLEPGVDIYSCGYETELVECWDGCWNDRNYDDCDEETEAWLEEFLDDNSVYDLEEHGWVQTDCEMILDDELEITLVEP
jgi:hypothetical protein